MHDQPLRDVVDEVLRVAQLGELPAEGIAEARLLVDAEVVLLAKAERLAADLLQRRRQPLRRDIGPAVAALLVGRALRRQLAREPLGELVDLLGGGGAEYSHGDRGIINHSGAQTISRPAADLARARAAGRRRRRAARGIRR